MDCTQVEANGADMHETSMSRRTNPEVTSTQENPPHQTSQDELSPGEEISRTFDENLLPNEEDSMESAGSPNLVQETNALGPNAISEEAAESPPSEDVADCVGLALGLEESMPLESSNSDLHENDTNSQDDLSPNSPMDDNDNDSIGNASGRNSDEGDTEERRSSSDGLELIEYHFIGGNSMLNRSSPEEEVPSVPIPAFIDFSPPPSVGNVPSIPTTPPPTYAEVMKDAIPLSFIDFWPQCVNLNDENFLFSKFETFDRVIDAANGWLLQQENVVIRNCETIETKASSLDEFIVLTATKTSTFKSNCRPLLCIKGLRLWYTSKIINKLPFAFAITPFSIAYRNYKATLVNVEDHLEFEKFPSLLSKCNNDIKSGIISGRILNVETVYLKEPDLDEPQGQGKLTFDPDDTTWRDFYSKNALQLLRVYYIPEQPVQEELFFKDFTPEKSRRSRSHPKFRDFTTVMDDCRLWLVHLNSQFRLINAQTLEMKYLPKERGKMDSNLTYFSDYEGIPRVRFLRVFYSKDTIDTDVEYGAPLLSHKTFIPAPLKKRRHETLAALMHRVETWLRATGATVVCAETLPMLEQVYQEKNDADFSLYRSEWMDANSEYDHETLLYVVRVYLDTVYPEPPPQIFLDGDDSDFDQDCALL